MIEKLFMEIAKDYNEEGKALFMGSVEKDKPPAVGVSGDTFCALIVLASAVRKLSEHTETTPQETLSAIGELIKEAENNTNDNLFS